MEMNESRRGRKRAKVQAENVVGRKMKNGKWKMENEKCLALEFSRNPWGWKEVCMCVCVCSREEKRVNSSFRQSMWKMAALQVWNVCIAKSSCCCCRYLCNEWDKRSRTPKWVGGVLTQLPLGELGGWLNSHLTLFYKTTLFHGFSLSCCCWKIPKTLKT